jgi:hypothetical protein
MHQTLEKGGTRVHIGPVGWANLRDAEGTLEFQGTIEQFESTASGRIYREAAAFALSMFGQDRIDELRSQSSTQLRELAELIIQGADALDAAHAIDEAAQP